MYSGGGGADDLAQRFRARARSCRLFMPPKCRKPPDGARGFASGLRQGAWTCRHYRNCCGNFGLRVLFAVATMLSAFVFPPPPFIYCLSAAILCLKHTASLALTQKRSFKVLERCKYSTGNRSEMDCPDSSALDDNSIGFAISIRNRIFWPTELECKST